MPDFQAGHVIGFHSCDREVGLRLLNGNDELLPSENSWDWLGPGSYFWEQDPARSLEYATENAAGKQFNKTAAKTPFVIGAIIDLDNCLNLVEAEALDILGSAYKNLKALKDIVGERMPINCGKNRELDCAVIKYIHQANIDSRKAAYDTIRCAFPQGDEAFPGSMITSRLHIQVCVCNPEQIRGYFLPRPVGKYNPHLKKS
jgi:hypothetical protein